METGCRLKCIASIPCLSYQTTRSRSGHYASLTGPNTMPGMQKMPSKGGN